MLWFSVCLSCVLLWLCARQYTHPLRCKTNDRKKRVINIVFVGVAVGLFVYCFFCCSVTYHRVLVPNLGDLKTAGFSKALLPCLTMHVFSGLQGFSALAYVACGYEKKERKIKKKRERERERERERSGRRKKNGRERVNTRNERHPGGHPRARVPRSDHSLQEPDLQL